MTLNQSHLSEQRRKIHFISKHVTNNFSIRFIDPYRFMEVINTHRTFINTRVREVQKGRKSGARER